MPLKKILCVEDEPDIRKILELSLESVGNYELDICGSGLEALEKVKSCDFDLILLDVMMPVMDGKEVFRRLKGDEKTKNIPVIFLTAKAQTNELHELEKLGNIGILTKPFDPMGLSRDVQELWDKLNAN